MHHSTVVVALTAGGTRTANTVRLQDFRGGVLEAVMRAVCCIAMKGQLFVVTQRCVANAVRQQQIYNNNQLACILCRQSRENFTKAL